MSSNPVVSLSLESPKVPRSGFLDCANRRKRFITVHRDIALAILKDHMGAVQIIDKL